MQYGSFTVNIVFHACPGNHRTIICTSNVTWATLTTGLHVSHTACHVACAVAPPSPTVHLTRRSLGASILLWVAPVAWEYMPGRGAWYAAAGRSTCCGTAAPEPPCICRIRESVYDWLDALFNASRACDLPFSAPPVCQPRKHGARHHGT